MTRNCIVKVYFKKFSELVIAIATRVIHEGLLPAASKKAEVLIPKRNGELKLLCLITSLAKSFVDTPRSFGGEHGPMFLRQFEIPKSCSVLTAK